MSAALVDSMDLTRTWERVPRHARGTASSSPLARPQHSSGPGGRPAGVAAPALRGAAVVESPAAVVGSDWHLSRRGLAVAVYGFLAVVTVAVVALVVGFLSVSNDPLPTAGSGSVSSVASSGN